MTHEQSRALTKEERNFLSWCYKLENKDENAINNDVALHSVAAFKATSGDCLSDRLRAAIAVMETEPDSPRKALYMAVMQDFARELYEEGGGFIERDTLENVGARYDGNGEIDYNFELVYKEPRLISTGEPSEDQIDHSPVTDRECDQIAFNDYCIMVVANPMARIDDIEALNTIADFENPDEHEKSCRLSAAIRLLRLQAPTPTARVIMAALKDSKDQIGIMSKIDGIEVNYDY
ncbi:hypothetical protein [Commensalibacter nepenthis]|uniref:Uncharacterized protein n=1 Tax=Commensalibacter nepenthis TaxID=3043872 RepID=A0ABT6QAJ8_9PROT|nr:hypothetical protein [Commensalibacter sp. TBRC 10068]MDI2113935.1 hypothetical protein [Commensalibacter sp. TBRC 10068]